MEKEETPPDKFSSGGGLELSIGLSLLLISLLGILINLIQQ